MAKLNTVSIRLYVTFIIIICRVKVLSLEAQTVKPQNGYSIVNVAKTRAPLPHPQANQTYNKHHKDLKTLSKSITKILNSFNASYDKRIRPNYGGEAVEVGITMYVLSISDVSEVGMEYTLDFYFRQMWKDPRLTFRGPKGVDSVSLSSEFLRTIWVPDTFFVNEKTSYFHSATTNNEFIRISQTGDIFRSMRLTVCASCPMDLRFFPIDSQLCSLEIESFGYKMEDLRYKWAEGAKSVGMAKDVSLPQFKAYGYRQKTYEISLSSGNYSRIAWEIHFVRSMGYYIIQIYIPSAIIVVISWVSFWINRNAAPARVYLGIATVLTMTTLMSSTNKELPKISYVKSIDVYMGTCFVMVFAALLEYATVGYLAKRIQMRRNHFAALQKLACQFQKEEHGQKPQQSQRFLSSHQHHRHHQSFQRSPKIPHTSGYNRQQLKQLSSQNEPKPQPHHYNISHIEDRTSSRGDSGSYSRGDLTVKMSGRGDKTSSGISYHHHPESMCGLPHSLLQEFRRHQQECSNSNGFKEEYNVVIQQQRPTRESGAEKIRQLFPYNPSHICGITPSDIDKYSRVVFPFFFVSFNLLYWIIYLHISNVKPPEDLVIFNYN